MREHGCTIAVLLGIGFVAISILLIVNSMMLLSSFGRMTPDILVVLIPLGLLAACVVLMMLRAVGFPTGAQDAEARFFSVVAGFIMMPMAAMGFLVGLPSALSSLNVNSPGGGLLVLFGALLVPMTIGVGMLLLFWNAWVKLRTNPDE